MAALAIPPKQYFNITVGVFFNQIISYTTDSGNLTWSAVGLPTGLSIDPNSGYISGTPTAVGNRSSFILVQNDLGESASTVVNFTVKPSFDNSLFFSIAPDKGYAQVTNYQFTTNINNTLSAYYLLWNFGDGATSNLQNPTHIYNLPGNYIVSLYAYTSSNIVSLSSTINVKLLLNESIYFDYVPPPTFAGHFNRYPFRVNYTSSKEGPHYIDLGAQFSRSYQNQLPENKWSFLRPEWRFLDTNGNPLDVLIPTEDPIYADELGVVNHEGRGLMVGVTGTAEFYFIDDIYNFDLFLADEPYTTIIATLRTSGIRSFNDSFNLDDNLPSFSNSLATVACPYITMYRQPDTLKVSENGIRGHLNPRWQAAPQPILVTANYKGDYYDAYYWNDSTNQVRLYDPDRAFAHYVPITGIPIELDLGGVGISANFIPQPSQFQWIDDTGYKTPGYYKGTFFTNTVSSLNALVTASAMIPTPVVSAQYHSPILWISNPEAGLMSTVQYTYSNALSDAITTPNLNIAQVHNFGMPIIHNVDFVKDPMALSGIHGVYSIAAMPFPSYHAWALDSELNYLYRLNTNGDILCAVDVNQVLYDNNLEFFSPKQSSPASIVLDSQQNIWMTLYDSISTLKFDRWGNFLFATTPLSSTGYVFPPAPNIAGPWYAENSYYDYDQNAPYDWNHLNNIDNNNLEPTCVDTDSNDNVWVTYSHYASGYLIKYNSEGKLIYSHAYPTCSCPQQIVVDNQDEIWVALSNNIWDATCTLEKRSTYGHLLSAIYPIRGLNYLTLDSNQNIWFTFSYSWIGTVDADTGLIYTINLSGSNQTQNAPDWLNPNYGNDETALEGIACDLKGRIYVINSVENQIYVLDSNQRKFLNKFYINPQGFTYYLGDQSGPTLMSASLWNKSLQASGDWSGLRWINKYGIKHLPYYKNDTAAVAVTGQSRFLNFISHENYDIFKKNENFDMASHMHSLAFMPSLNESEALFKNFLGSVYGTYPVKHDDFGTETYEKIANYVANHSDIDFCNINQLYDMAEEIGIDSEDFRVNFPANVQRIMDFASINQSRLFGANSLSQDAFKIPNNQGETNKGNLLNTQTYVVTAGIPVVLKDKTINKYRLVPTGEIFSHTNYSLYDLANFIGLNQGWGEYYEFYSFVPSYDMKQMEGFIDWENPQTTINQNLSTSDFWIGSEGFIETEFSYELYKGLGFI
jgi:PKD repeat protein